MSESQPSMVIVGGRRRGRPPAESKQQERLSTRLPTPQYDRLVKMAGRRDQTVSALVRQILLAQSFLR